MAKAASPDDSSDPRLHSPLLSDEADVELAALQVFAGVAHDLVEGVFQQVVAADDQPERHTTVP